MVGTHCECVTRCAAIAASAAAASNFSSITQLPPARSTAMFQRTGAAW